MFSHVFRPFRRAVQALVAGDTPRQLAAGFALGMVLGLMPKGNLIAVTLCVLLFSLRTNAGLGLAAALLFSWVGTLADPFTHQLGTEVLRIDALQAGYASVYGMPLGPWLGFQNTVVMGSMLVGLYLVYPAYWTTYATSRWIQRRRATRSSASESVEELSPSDARPREVAQ